MTYTSTIWMLTLTALVALWPRECAEFSLWLFVQFRIFTLDVQLFVVEWIMYRRLKRNFAQHGIQIPPFKYTPLRERNL